MENKQSEYVTAKVFEIENLRTVRFLELSAEDVEIGATDDFWEFLYVDTGEIMLGLDGNGYQTFAIELHDGSNTISFPVVSGNIVNPVEVIGTLSFYFEGDIPYACIEVDEVNKVECVFK